MSIDQGRYPNIPNWFERFYAQTPGGRIEEAQSPGSVPYSPVGAPRTASYGIGGLLQGIGDRFSRDTGELIDFGQNIGRFFSSRPQVPAGQGVGSRAFPSTGRTGGATDSSFRAENARLMGAGSRVAQGAEGLSPEELEALRQQYFMDRIELLTRGGGGGGINLSGFDPMFSDLDARRAGLDTRRAEQEAFLQSLFEAAQARTEGQREAAAAAIEAQLAADSARRAQDIGLVRGQEAERMAVADAARGALGAEVAPDLSSEIAQNVVGGIGASGSVASESARNRQSILEQQLASEIAGLTPMQQMAMMDLNRGYEDRLSNIDSERAALQAQIAQMRAAASGSGGRQPSLSELFELEDRANAMYGPGEAPEFSGLLGTEQQFRTRFGSDANEIFGIADRLLSTAMQSREDPTRPATMSGILQSMRTEDPALNDFLNRNSSYVAAIVNYATTAAKGE